MAQALTQTSSRMWFLNGDFDLELGGQSTNRLARDIAEMTLWFVPVADPLDWIHLEAEPDPFYWEYLEQIGFSSPKRADPGSTYPHVLGIPWGFSPRSLNLFRSYAAKVEGPDLEVVKLVNGRRFARELAHQLCAGVPEAIALGGSTKLSREIIFEKNLVIKSEHGNAGRGLFRPNEMDSEAFWRLAQSDKAAVLEPWLERIGDVSSRFELTQNATVERLSHHRTLVGPDGHFFGIYLEPDEQSFAPFVRNLEQVALQTAYHLSRVGYFGTVGIDAFFYRDQNGEIRLANLVDLNCREIMSTIVYAVRKKLDLSGYLLFRTLSVKRHQLPSSYGAWHEKLGKLAYHPRSKQGVICLTPLRAKVGSGTYCQPKRTCLLAVANQRNVLQEMVLDLGAKLFPGGHCRLPDFVL